MKDNLPFRWTDVTYSAISLAVCFLSGCTFNSQIAEPVVLTASTSEDRPKLEGRKNPAPTVSDSDVDEQNTMLQISKKINVFFDQGSNKIRPSEKAKIQTIASQLKDDRSKHVTLIGYANSNGSRTLNLAVAASRVESVGNLLRAFGVNAQQIKKLSMGDEKTPSACRSVQCRNMMRRVEVAISSGN